MAHAVCLARSAVGECQGSGAQPYVVGVDLRTPELASKCSCPSRKFPCKHALALLLLEAGQQGTWTAAPLPDTLQKWLDGRQARAETAATPKPEKPVDPAAKAKREAARSRKITRGLEDLHLWLQDLIREGLQAARTRSYRDWDTQAARLIDAQAPGAARLVRQIPEHLPDETGEALLMHLGKVALLCEGWQQRETLSEPERAQLLTALGQPLSTALPPGDAPADHWTVMGAHTEQDGKLNARRTWLRRDSDSKIGVLLEFAPQGTGLSAEWPARHSAALNLHFVPTAHPQRLISGSADARFSATSQPPSAVGIRELYAEYARALALNPWTEFIGFEIGPVSILPDPPQAHDDHGDAVPLADADPYALLAHSAGQRMHLFGEWDGRAFRPLSAVPERQVDRP
ncbi:SWIM zinc finger family protein [Deinococcus sp. KNUC1210]|uniref:SWIM zinc finger family protein n=1 Tax=Deinococcus sp. KNUC1210 TaxID=2917691 RepID=UPI001EF095CF|nr:SWIM zinc finger family protein [Deinococcus sp. KNUC1210]ULH16169.1 SWIM zinc finger family protein [Deinococcus sp. KNUC1210]